MPQTVTVLLGTTKGLFLLRSDADRANWTVQGPFCEGWPINQALGDPATGTIWAAGGDEFPGAGVWRSEDSGETWTACRDGLPGRDCYFTVLRQAMATDGADRAGVYFGTNSGSVFASRDEGDSWAEIARHLPTILSVETLTSV